MPEKSIVLGEIEPLIVSATSLKTLSTDAYSINYPNDIIHVNFDFDNIPISNKQYRTGVADDVGILEMMGTGSTIFEILFPDSIENFPYFKGIITNRKDPLKNIETTFDFRNVTHRLWNISQPEWTGTTEYEQGSLVEYNDIIYSATTYISSGGTSPDYGGDWAFIMNTWGNEYICFNPNYYVPYDIPDLSGLTISIFYESYVDSYTITGFTQSNIKIDCGLDDVYHIVLINPENINIVNSKNIIFGSGSNNINMLSGCHDIIIPTGSTMMFFESKTHGNILDFYFLTQSYCNKRIICDCNNMYCFIRYFDGEGDGNILIGGGD
jgi:hypothetical protein